MAYSNEEAPVEAAMDETAMEAVMDETAVEATMEACLSDRAIVSGYGLGRANNRRCGRSKGRLLTGAQN